MSLLEVREGPGGALHLEGEFDMSCEKTFELATANLATAATLNVSELTFMDATGVRCILRLAGSNGPVVLRDPRHAVMRVLEVTGLDRHPNVQIER